MHVVLNAVVRNARSGSGSARPSGALRASPSGHSGPGSAYAALSATPAPQPPSLLQGRAFAPLSLCVRKETTHAT
jgi:hypothetical protein